MSTGSPTNSCKTNRCLKKFLKCCLTILHGAEIIAHNATFDMNFLDMEFKRAGFKALSEVCDVTDTLALAKSRASRSEKTRWMPLVRRYEIPQRDRAFHGALLDAEILSDVYLGDDRWTGVF